MGAAQGRSVDRFTVWCEILGTWWAGLPAAFALCGAAEFVLGWKIPGVERIVGGWTWLFLVLATLLAVVLHGSQRALTKREHTMEEQRQEIDRIRTPQSRLAQAKYHLYRDAFMCTQLVGFMMMTRMDASAMTPETALGIERSWGDGFLERFRRMFGAGRFGDVFSTRMGGMFPPPRNRAMAIYVGLADFLRLLAERITEDDLDPAYLHGADESPEETAGEPAALPAH
jgi:hypothetical protein